MCLSPMDLVATNKFFVLVDVTNNETKKTERIAPTITLLPDER